jgi:hypothetical protein
VLCIRYYLTMLKGPLLIGGESCAEIFGKARTISRALRIGDLRRPSSWPIAAANGVTTIGKYGEWSKRGGVTLGMGFRVTCRVLLPVGLSVGRRSSLRRIVEPVLESPARDVDRASQLDIGLEGASGALAVEP